ncbi:MAG: dTDP-4-dehydrorhamnose 3,5-epimerase [Bacilli bacterium]
MNSIFKFKETTLKGAFVIEVLNIDDERGKFTKDFNIEIFKDNGIDFDPKEIFYAHSKKNVLRGIHFQKMKQQAKLVRCLSGHIYDVIVDLRKESVTYGKWEAFDLTGENNIELYIPENFGHGYYALTDSIVSYKCSEVFFPQYDSGIIWNDQDLKIIWPLNDINQDLIISKKDKNLYTFRNYNEEM